MKLTLKNLPNVPSHVVVPNYDMTAITPGIVHIGFGNFAMAHLGSIMDDILKDNPTWGIIAADIRSGAVINGLHETDNLYVMIARKRDHRTARVLGSVVDTIYAPGNPDALVQAIANPAIRLVTITVTAAGYYLDVNRTGLDAAAADIKHDLECPQDAPKTIYPYLLRGITERLKQNGQPLVVMSLDNVEANSAGLKTGLMAYAALAYPNDPGLIARIKASVDFPVTLIDRITPRTTDEAKAEAMTYLGFDPVVLVVTESFRQLVHETTRFPVPNWHSAGVMTVDNASSWWQKKFFLVNCGHQVVAIPGLRMGEQYIHTAAAALPAGLLAQAHKEMGLFLGASDALTDYAAAVEERFADEALNDLVVRVAARWTEKASQRILSAIELAYAASGSMPRALTFVFGVWLLNLSGVDESGNPIPDADEELANLRDGNPENSPAAELARLLDETAPEAEAVDADALEEIVTEIGVRLYDPRIASITGNEAFMAELSWSVLHIHRHGVRKAAAELLSRA